MTRGPNASELTPDQFKALGMIFTGTGVAMTIAIGPSMVWMIALAVIHLAMAAPIKRNSSE